MLKKLATICAASLLALSCAPKMQYFKYKVDQDVLYQGPPPFRGIGRMDMLRIDSLKRLPSEPWRCFYAAYTLDGKNYIEWLPQDQVKPLPKADTTKNN